MKRKQLNLGKARAKESEREGETHKQFNILLNARDYSPTQYCHSPARVKCLWVVLLYWYVFTTAIHTVCHFLALCRILYLSSSSFICSFLSFACLCLHRTTCAYMFVCRAAVTLELSKQIQQALCLLRFMSNAFSCVAHSLIYSPFRSCQNKVESIFQ